MKNIIIIILVVIVAALGYLVITNNKVITSNNIEPKPQATISSSPIESPTNETTQQPISGRTLDLSGRGLEKIDQKYFDDTSITILNVSNNNLTGALPAEIRKLKNLQVLDASNNKMTGIPAEIGQLSELRIANFANNNISGLPLEIGNLKNLQTLDLRGNPNVSQYDLSKIQPQIPNAQILTD